MKTRWIYGTAAAVLFLAEILIALYVRDAFLRPYGGDILVTLLLCCFLRAVFRRRIPQLPLWVLLFAFAVEFAQALGVTSLIPEGWTVLRIAVGNSFSVWDLVCYAVGCLLFAGAEGLAAVRKIRKFEKDY